jgi:hypothetical protein
LFVSARQGLDKRQWAVLFALVGLNAALAFFTLALGLTEMLPGQAAASELPDVPNWVLGLANAGLILVAYGALGAAGVWLGHRAGLPGVYRCGGGRRRDAGWRKWAWLPLIYGLIVGVLMVAGDRAFAALGDWGGLAHPAFPLSLLASASAGIGEEVIFRGFVMGVWAWLLTRFLKGARGTGVALWIANGIAALAFAAGHLPAVMLLYDAQTPLELPPALLLEMLVLNGLVALVAGERYRRDGLVAAMGVHFWADIVWHVIWPLVSRS